jgi:hypothetical protein
VVATASGVRSEAEEKMMGYAIYGTGLGLAGYDVIDTCRQEGCLVVIDRGLDHLCGDQPERPSESDCGRWFCEKHLYGDWPRSRCRACLEVAEREQVRVGPVDVRSHHPRRCHRTGL